MPLSKEKLTLNRQALIMTKTVMIVVFSLLWAGAGYAGNPLPPLPTPERTQLSNAASARLAPGLPEPQPSKVKEPSVAKPSLIPPLSGQKDKEVLPTSPPGGQAVVSDGHVARATFTSDIEDREPVDQLVRLESEPGQVYFFTELRDMTGQIARHRWQYNDQIVAEKTFEIKGPRWRVWSGRPFETNHVGVWKVSVLNNANQVMVEQVLPVNPTSIAAEP
jgi:hypothetical protein